MDLWATGEESRGAVKDEETLTRCGRRESEGENTKGSVGRKGSTNYCLPSADWGENTGRAWFSGTSVTSGFRIRQERPPKSQRLGSRPGAKTGSCLTFFL